jgi:hypothetical protein
MPKTCQRCNATFDCSVNSTASHTEPCWCMGYPAIFSPDAAGDCVCPNCLTAMTQVHIAATIDTQAIHVTSPAAAVACQGQPLIEGLDYTIEDGFWVFSRWYLLKQGACCGNGCRHCPYGHVNVK